MSILTLANAEKLNGAYNPLLSQEPGSPNVVLVSLVLRPSFLGVMSWGLSLLLIFSSLFKELLSC